MSNRAGGAITHPAPHTLLAVAGAMGLGNFLPTTAIVALGWFSHPVPWSYTKHTPAGEACKHS